MMYSLGDGLGRNVLANDVSNLLDQLGQPDFYYREFPEQTEVDAPGYWPIFGAIIGDPALAGLPGARQEKPPLRNHKKSGPLSVSVAESADHLTPNTERRVGGPGAIFRHYAEEPPASAAALSPQGSDIRGLLRRLSDQLR
jgi:hypothetical protein